MKCASAPARTRICGKQIDPEAYRGHYVQNPSDGIHFQKELIPQSTYNPEKRDKSYMEMTFEVERLLDRNSFSEVQKMKRKADGKIVAVKTISTYGGGGPISHQDRLQECAFCLMINHINLLKTYEVIEQQGFFHVIMEYCLIDLGKVTELPEAERFGERDIWDLVCDMLRALRYLEKNDIVHLDIKPMNILLSEQGIWKLGDFGLMRTTKGQMATRKSNMQEGDSTYTAPETMKSKFGPACDVYSMGLVFVEVALSVDLPKTGGADESMPYHALRKMPDHTWFREPMKNRGYSETLTELIDSMLKYERKERPRAEELTMREDIKTKLVTRAKEYDTPTPRQKLAFILENVKAKDVQESKMYKDRAWRERMGDFSRSVLESERGILTMEEELRMTRMTPLGDLRRRAMAQHYATEPRLFPDMGQFPATPFIKKGLNGARDQSPTNFSLRSSSGEAFSSADDSPTKMKKLSESRNKSDFKIGGAKNLMKDFDEVAGSLDPPLSPIPALAPFHPMGHGGETQGNLGLDQVRKAHLDASRSPPLCDMEQLEVPANISIGEEMDMEDSNVPRSLNFDMNVTPSPIAQEHHNGSGCSEVEAPRQGEVEAPCQGEMEEMDTDTDTA